MDGAVELRMDTADTREATDRRDVKRGNISNTTRRNRNKTFLIFIWKGFVFVKIEKINLFEKFLKILESYF